MAQEFMPTVVLQAEGLTKRYGSLTAVDNLSLEVYAGEVFGFLGPNGAGKTTSINMICGLLKPDAGRVRVMAPGASPRSNGEHSRLRVGVCPQANVLWERLTCLEQLQFIGQMYGLPARLARQRGEQLLAELDLSEKARKRAGTLSGGMQRRLNIAMALVHDPEIVLLDEPEAGLDPQSRVKVREYIQSLARKKTVILTTHNMDEAERLADRVAIIDQGRLLVLDTPEALKQRMGAGDVLEIELDASGEDGERACAALAFLQARPTWDAPRQALHLRLLDAVRFLPGIIEALSKAGLPPLKISLHANTLEDVFIHLTGRRLRE